MILDWIAAAGTLVAAELVTRRRWQGFALHSANGVLWAYLMWKAQFWGLFTLELFFVAQALWSARRWGSQPVDRPRKEVV